MMIVSSGAYPRQYLIVLLSSNQLFLIRNFFVAPFSWVPGEKGPGQDRARLGISGDLATDGNKMERESAFLLVRVALCLSRL